MSHKWLVENVRGFAGLSRMELRAFSSFWFLWSLFELRIMECSANATSICRTIDNWDRAGELHFDRYSSAFSYYKKRYVEEHQFNGRFYALSFRTNDCESIVVSAFEDDADDLQKTKAVFLIIWRLRNNFAHGKKMKYALEDQFQNFRHANIVLMRTLAQYGNLDLEI